MPTCQDNKRGNRNFSTFCQVCTDGYYKEGSSSPCSKPCRQQVGPFETDLWTVVVAALAVGTVPSVLAYTIYGGVCPTFPLKLSSRSCCCRGWLPVVLPRQEGNDPGVLPSNTVHAAYALASVMDRAPRCPCHSCAKPAVDVGPSHGTIPHHVARHGLLLYGMWWHRSKLGSRDQPGATPEERCLQMRNRTDELHEVPWLQAFSAFYKPFETCYWWFKFLVC